MKDGDALTERKVVSLLVDHPRTSLLDERMFFGESNATGRNVKIPYVVSGGRIT
jgi:hypothetical protein